MDFDTAAASEKGLADLTDQERSAIVSDPSASRNGLYSSELGLARGDVHGTENPVLIQAFDKLAFTLIGGNGVAAEMTQSNNRFFASRNAIGIGISRALQSGDTTILDRETDTSPNVTRTTGELPNQALVQAELGMLKLAVQMHAMQNGIELTSEHQPGGRNPVAAHESRHEA